MKFLNCPLLLATSLIALVPQSRAAAVLPVEIAFDTESDYTDSFTSVNGSGITYDSEAGNLVKTGTGTQNLLFNETGLADVTVSLSASFSGTAPSIGLWQGVTGASSSGFLGLVSRLSDTQVRLRIYTANLGTNLGSATAFYDQTFSISAFTTNTFYTVSFTAIDTSGGTDVTLSFLNGSGDLLATSGSVSSAANMNGSQVGFRAASQTITLDDFAVSSAIPEPATAAALLGLCAAGIAFLRRRRAA